MDAGGKRRLSPKGTPAFPSLYYAPAQCTAAPERQPSPLLEVEIEAAGLEGRAALRGHPKPSSSLLLLLLLLLWRLLHPKPEVRLLLGRQRWCAESVRLHGLQLRRRRCRCVQLLTPVLLHVTRRRVQVC